MPRPALLVLFLCLLPALSARADSIPGQASAESYIADLFRATAETATQSGSEEIATNAVQTLLATAVPLDEVSRFVLGRYRPRTDNSSEAARFQEALQVFIAEAVTRGLRAYRGTTLAVHGQRARPDGGWLVASTLQLPAGPALPMDWVVDRDPVEGRFQVRDFTLAGIDAEIMLRGMTEDVLGDGRGTIADVVPRFRAGLRRLAPAAVTATAAGSAAGTAAP